MSLLDRFRSRPAGGESPPSAAPTSLPNLRVLRASGQRIDLSARDVGMRIAATRQAWQQDAWDYYGRIGELSYALRLLAQQVAKVRFYAAEIRPYPDDPVELAGNDHGIDADLANSAVSELARLPLDDDGVDSFIATLTLNLLVAGEAWIHGQAVDGEEQWSVRSVSEITAQGDQVMLAELPSSTTLGQRQIQEDEEELLRCWVRHPRYGQLAYSPLLSALDIMEGIILDGREARAAAQSRIAANGILLVPDSLSFAKTRQEVEALDEQSIMDDTLMDDLTEMMVIPIKNEGHPGAVVPMVIRGPADDLKELRHVKLDRADPEKLTERQAAGVMRLLKSLDIQPEQVEGVGSMNHWCADTQTEILSSRGWLTQEYLNVGDTVLTLNHETGLSEWQPVLDIYRAEVVDERMISIEGNRHSSLTTRDHRWPVWSRCGREWVTSSDIHDDATTAYRSSGVARGRRHRATELRASGWPYREIGAELGVSEAMAWSYINKSTAGLCEVTARPPRGRTGYSLPLAAPHAELPSQPKYDDALVELIAWFSTEGSASVRHGRRTPRVTIYQSNLINPDNVVRIRRALTGLFGPESAQLDKGGRYATAESVARRAKARELRNNGWKVSEIADTLSVSESTTYKYLTQDAKPGPCVPKWREYRTGRGMSNFRLNAEAANVILPHAPGRVVTREFVFAMTASQLELFLDTAVRGDGSRQAGGTGSPNISQKDPAMLDAMEIAAILAGYSVIRYTMTGLGRSATGPRLRTQHVLAFTDNSLRTKYAPGSASVAEAAYSGTVWCPTTINGTWMARRRGTVYFTGNSGWVVEAKDVKQQVDPWAATVGGCLTKAFHRPALLALDHEPDQVRRIAVCHDVSGLVENPNRGQDARDAHDRLVISDGSLRHALGFGDDDKPDDDELQRRIAAKVGVDQGTAALVLEMARGVQNGRPRVIDMRQGELPSGRPRNGNGAHPARPGDIVPERPIPNEPTSVANPARGMVAAATPALLAGWRVDVDAARALTDIDAALAERIITAADAAIARAVERAGGRARTAIRTRAKNDTALAAAIDGVDAVMIPGRVGKDVLLASLSLSDLLFDAFTRLRGQFFGWITQAAAQAADAVLRLLGLSRRSAEGRRVHDAVTSRLAVHQEAGWTALAGALDAAAERAMFRTDPLTPERPSRGEGLDTLISPVEVTRALVVAGGGDPDRPGDGGLATGPVTREAMTEQGGVTLGWEWQYRPERPRNTFPPHAALDGARFDTWTDPQLATDEKSRWVGAFLHPGDHRGCRCLSVPLLAFPEPNNDVVSQRLRESRESERGLTLTRVAAEDTAAGRVGTTIQRDVEVRDRLAAEVEQLRQHYIEGVRR